MVKRYNSITDYYRRTFDGYVQKISVDAGFSCPNRDGNKGIGGCTYCNNNAFTPSYCLPHKTIAEQLDEGIKFFSRKYKDASYLAYFQPYSNTYASLDILKTKYQEALSHKGVIGLIISTRPDCVSADILDYLSQIAKDYYLVVEYGIESTNNTTLEYINRAHTYEEAVQAIEQTALRGIKIGAHLILGLPGEERKDFITHAKRISQLPINFLKLHQLQIFANTLMSRDYKRNKSFYRLFNTADEYLEVVVEFLEYLRPDIIVERFVSQSPLNLLIAPKWSRVKNYTLVHKIEQMLSERNTWQGRKFNGL